MTIQNLIDLFLAKPCYLEMGAGKLSKRYSCSKDDIYRAKEGARAQIQIKDLASFKIEIEEEIFKAKYVGSSPADDGGTVKKFESATPLSTKEIEDLVQVDGINTWVARVWEKLLPSGKWTYSIDVRYRMKDFYTTEELKEKLKEIFPAVSSVTLPDVAEYKEKALVILLADDHAGALNTNSIFGNEWTSDTYQARMDTVIEQILKLDTTFEEVHIISLGDQMNGWNAQTTRGGHEVKSLPNKEQFDIYTTVRKKFYDSLFASGVGFEYHVHDIENSNHTGKGFSYMANKLLEVYIEAKFPEVTRKSYFLPIEGFDYGIHTIAFGHGKDEEFMKRPMPLKLNPQTDLLLFHYFDKKGYSPSERRITFYKGDLHSFAIDKGKFGRYINTPSIMGSSDYSEPNYGDTEPGALLEVFEKNSSTISTIPIWF